MSDVEHEYYLSSLGNALDDIGIKYTSDQLDELTDYVQGIQEVKSQALGYDCIPNPLQTEMDNLKRKHKEELKELEKSKNAIEDLALRARGLSNENAYIRTRDGRANFELR